MLEAGRKRAEKYAKDNKLSHEEKMALTKTWSVHTSEATKLELKWELFTQLYGSKAQCMLKLKNESGPAIPSNMFLFPR